MQNKPLAQIKNLPIAAVAVVLAAAIAVPALSGTADRGRNDTLDAQIAELQRDADNARDPESRRAAEEKLAIVLAEREALLAALDQPEASAAEDAAKAQTLRDYVAETAADAAPEYILQEKTLSGSIIQAVAPGGAEFRARTAWLGPEQDDSRIRVYAGVRADGRAAVRIYRETPVGAFPMQFVTEVALPGAGMAEVTGEPAAAILEVTLEDGSLVRLDTRDGSVSS